MDITSPSPHIAMASHCLSEHEVHKVFVDTARFDYKDATIDAPNGQLFTVRQGTIRGLIPDKENEWLYDKVIDTMMVPMNRLVTKQDWRAFVETIQIARYEVNDHYDIHFDGLGNGKRKLSLTIQLSDPDEYEGGELRLGLPNNPVTMTKEKGDACLFPSWMPHWVEPVTSGVRYSLVAWGHGPAVR